jgi:hypothetical protein
MPKKKETPWKLTEQQKYLLHRIPSQYQMNGYKELPMPTEVRRAEALVNRWQKQEKRRQCQADKRNQALRTKAREAVYFDTPQKALAIVRQCEKLLKGCED